MDPRKKTTQGEAGSGHHLEAGQEVPQVWEGVQALGLKHTVLVKNVISKEIHIGDLVPCKPWPLAQELRVELHFLRDGLQELWLLLLKVRVVTEHDELHAGVDRKSVV